MKPEVIRSATDAHSWVGVVLSLPLFIVFWAGTITVFYPEIKQWSVLPHYTVDAKAQKLSVNDILEIKLQEYEFDNARRLTIRLPNEKSPFYRIFIPTMVDEEGVQTNSHVTLFVDPVTGETLASDKKLNYPDFLYQLHYNLKIPMGNYVVGVLSLFLAIIIFTGIVIHIKKLVYCFFLYRKDKSLRYRLTDAHNIIGVISLPYTLMYALTGFIFNVSVLFQVPTLFSMYQGDVAEFQSALGYAIVKETPVNNPIAMPDLEALIEKIELEKNAEISSLKIHNYGDENAVIRFRGEHVSNFGERIDLHYRVRDDTYPRAYNNAKYSFFFDGNAILYTLHFGHFAGFDLRFMYFLLGFSACALIVLGNVLWLNKRLRKSHSSVKLIKWVNTVTVGGCLGVILATSVGFLLERILPLETQDRDSIIKALFFLFFLAAIAVSHLIHSNRRFISSVLIMVSATLVLTVLADIGLVCRNLWQLWMQGFYAPSAISISFLIIAFILLILVVSSPLKKGKSY